MRSGRDGSTRQADGRFGLTLHPDKTRLLPFRRPPSGQSSGKGRPPSTFLVSRCTSARAKTGRWGCGCKTRSARLRRKSSPSPDCVGATDTTGQGATRSASADASRGTTITSASAHFSLSVAGAAGSKARLVQVAPPSESKNASELGEVFGNYSSVSLFRVPVSVSESGAPSHEPHRRGAVWWKSPRYGSGRGPGAGRPLLATLQHHFAFHRIKCSDIGMLYEAACAASWRRCKRRASGWGGLPSRSDIVARNLDRV